MKKIIFIFFTALLSACTNRPNLVGTQSPILNIEAALSPQLEVNLHQASATVINKSQHQLPINYLITWYDKNGVTQLAQGEIDEQFRLLPLNAKEKTTLYFPPPTPESVNYRLYMALKGNH